MIPGGHSTPRRVTGVSVFGARNASARARLIEWANHLGWPFDLISYTDAASARANLARAPARVAAAEMRLRHLLKQPLDVVVLNREATPLGAGEIESRLLEKSSLGIYDLDDALHLDRRGPVFERYFSKASTARRAVESADVVVAGNAFLAEWASTIGSGEVRIVPTCVAPDRYVVKSKYEPRKGLSAVWLGTWSGEQYLSMIATPLLEASRRFGLTLTIVGALNQHLGELEAIITRIPWSLDVVHSQLHRFDLGLMPLRSSDYERGKCAYKLLEYGAAGLPVIASPIGPNAGILDASVNPSALTIDDWTAAIESFATTGEDERRRMGVALRRCVVEGYSYAAHAATWSDILLA